jgi:hypothetical protein
MVRLPPVAPLAKGKGSGAILAFIRVLVYPNKCKWKIKLAAYLCLPVTDGLSRRAFFMPSHKSSFVVKPRMCRLFTE